MTKRLEVYKCSVCGNIVSVLHASDGTLVCCGKPMNLMKEKIKEEGEEKHLPVIEKTKDGYKVKIGSVPHPMTKEHYIEWIELVTENKSYRKFLKPGYKPEAVFRTNDKAVTVREYCNIHGLWKNKNY